MKTMNLNFFIHRPGGARVYLALALICVAWWFWKKARSLYLNFRFRGLAPVLGEKTKDGYVFEVGRRKAGVYEIKRCDHLLALSDLYAKKEIIQRHSPIRIGGFSEEKKGFWLWKKSVFLIHEERKTKNYIFKELDSGSRSGDWEFGRAVIGGIKQIENADQGAFSARISGTAGSGKTNYSCVAAQSLCLSSKKSHESLRVLIFDPKQTSYLWAERQHGAKIFNPLELESLSQGEAELRAVYSEILGISESLKQNGIHIRHVKELTPEQWEKIGFKFTRTLVVFEEYERYWSSQRQAKRPTKEDDEHVRREFELYQKQNATGALCNHLLGIGRAYGVCVLASSQSALLGSSEYPAENNFQILAASKISPEASLRLFQDRLIATDANCLTGEFIVKSEKFGIRKVQVPLFQGDES